MTDRTASTVIICFAVIGLSFGCTAAESGTPADLIAYNGHIVTLDPQSSEAQALAVRDGRIVAVGTDAEVLALAGPDTEQIDLAGQTVVPGLADNHFHGIGGGAGVDLSEVRSLEEVHDAIAARAAQTPAGEIIRTNSDWHEGQLAEQRLPQRRASRWIVGVQCLPCNKGGLPDTVDEFREVTSRQPLQDVVLWNSSVWNERYHP